MISSNDTGFEKYCKKEEIDINHYYINDWRRFYTAGRTDVISEVREWAKIVWQDKDVNQKKLLAKLEELEQREDK